MTPKTVTARCVRRVATSPTMIGMLCVCILVGAAGTFADAVDTTVGLGPLQWLVLAKDAVSVYGVLVVSILGAILGAGVGRLGEVTAVHGASWGRQVRTTWSAALPLGLVGGAAVLIGVAGAGIARSGTARLADDMSVDLGLFLGRTLAAFSLAAVVGAALGLAGRLTTATAVLVALQVPALPALRGLYVRSETAQELLGLLPFGAIRGLSTGNSGTFVGSFLAAYTRQPSVLLVAALLTWLLALWVWSATIPWRRGERAYSGMRGRWIAPAAGVALAAMVGGLAGQFGVSAVPWRWTPAWRQATASNENSRQVTEQWIEALRSQHDDVAQSLVADGHASDVPAEVQDAFRRAATVRVQAEDDMQDPEHVLVDLTFDPHLDSGQLVIDRAQVAVELSVARGDGWRVVATDYPALHVEVRR